MIMCYQRTDFDCPQTNEMLTKQAIIFMVLFKQFNATNCMEFIAKLLNCNDNSEIYGIFVFVLNGFK